MNRAMRQEVLKANLLLNELGLVIFTWGNVSGIDRTSGMFAIKPSGVLYDELRAEDLVLVDLAGDVVEGSLRPLLRRMISDACRKAVRSRPISMKAACMPGSTRETLPL